MSAFQIAFFMMLLRDLCTHLAHFVVEDFIFGTSKIKTQSSRWKATKGSDEQRASKKRNRAAVPLLEKFI